MKILFASYFPLGIGGAEVSALSLAKGLKGLGHEVFFVSTGIYPGFKTFKINKLKNFYFYQLINFLLVREFTKLIKKNNIKIIHSHDYITAPAVILAAKNCGIKSVTHYRDYWFCCPIGSCMMPNGKICKNCSTKKLFDCKPLIKTPWFIYKLNYLRKIKKILNKADLKLAISSAVKIKLDLAGIKESKIVPNSIDINNFKKIKNNEFEELNDKKLNITFIGSVKYHKGVFNILKVISKIYQKNKNIRFIIAGKGKIKSPKFVKRVGFVPHSKISKLYQISDAIVFPSIWEEPFGRIAIETMASGKPIVASNIGGIKDIVKDQETGFLIKPNDLNDWEKKLIQLIKNPPLRKKMGYNGKKEAENYTNKKIAKKIQQYYLEITNT